MTLEKAVLAKLKRLPVTERERLLRDLAQQIEASQPTLTDDTRAAVAAVERTWASLAIDSRALRWAAEDKSLEYAPK